MAAAPKVAAKSTLQRLRGGTLGYVAWVTGVAVVPAAFLVFLVVMFSVNGFSSNWGGLIANIAISLTLAAHYALVTFGRRSLAMRRRVKALRDPRPQLVYLRSFSDDEAPYRWTRLSRRKLTWRSFYLRTYEERLAYALRYIGPFIALGDPQDKLPDLGAMRTYVGEGDWRQRVIDMITKAQLVVFQIGDTDSLVWEICQAVQRVDPRRVILCLPMDKSGERPMQDRYARFRAKASALFPQPLPAEIGEAQFIYFDEHWTPCAFTPVRTAELPPVRPGDAAVGTQRSAMEAFKFEFLRLSTRFATRFALYALALLLLVTVPPLLVYRSHQQAQAELARAAEQKFLSDQDRMRLAAQIAEEQKKIDKLITQLVSAKDEPTRLKLQKQIDEEKAKLDKMRSSGAAPKATGAKPAKPCNCTPGDPLCSCL